MKRWSVSLLLIFGLISAGMQTAQAKIFHKWVKTYHATFQCETGDVFSVAFRGDKALMKYEKNKYHLKAQPVGSGSHYAGAGQDLKGKGIQNRIRISHSSL